MEFTKSILFTTTCEGRITNISYKKEAQLVISILKSLDTKILEYEIIEGAKENSQVDIAKFQCENGVIKIPNVSDLDNEEFANNFINEFNSSVKNKSFDDNILCIGCNYGEYLSNGYVKLITPVKRSNRGRKKKEKKKSTRKKIGNGKYFNSQVTITLKDPEKLEYISHFSKEENIVDNEIFTVLKSCMYHIKIYTNGKFQVPFVRDEDVYTVKSSVDKAISLVDMFDFVKIDVEKKCEVEYIKSIMKNYRFNIDSEDTLIDIKKLKKIVSLFKLYHETNKNIDERIDDINIEVQNINISNDEKNHLLNEFEKKWDVLSQRKITLIKYNNDNYTGFVIKFLTPFEDNQTKETTASLFDSNKINLYGCTDKKEADVLKDIIYGFLTIDDECCLYKK